MNAAEEAKALAGTPATVPVVSIVIPSRNEGENLEVLLPEIAGALAGVAYEIVVVDDGSTDNTVAVVERCIANGISIVRLAHDRSLGKSAALVTGVRAAAAELVVTLDGDGQNDPAIVLPILARFVDPALGLVAGQRVGRKSSAAKKYGSRLANRVRRALLKDDTRDTACGVKGFRRSPFVDLPYFENMHRFLPALFLGDGWKIGHIDVVDRPREHGASNYGIWDRLSVGIADLFGVWWLLKRRRRSPFRVEHPR